MTIIKNTLFKCLFLFHWLGIMKENDLVLFSFIRAILFLKRLKRFFYLLYLVWSILTSVVSLFI